MSPEIEKYQQRLRDLVPVEGLSPALQDELFERAEIVEYPQGRFVFREGDTDDYNYYLLEGELEMSTHGTVTNRYVGGSDTCRYPVAQLRPRKFSAQVAKPAMVFRVHRHHLDELQRRHASGGGVIQVEEAAGGGDWMSSMLQSELFSRIPATNLQRLFAAVDYIEVQAGQEIITQGDPGDFYYIIHQGTCDVLVEPKSGGKKVRVATLKPNDSFGEEALVTDAARNATIRMTSPGQLLRLGKSDFQALIRDVLLESVSFDKAERMVAEGARWLDVRFVEDFEKVSIPGALNIPFNVLRLRREELDPDTRYITYCNNGLRSSVAAFLLIQRGFDVCFLDRGLENSPLAGRLAAQNVDTPTVPGTTALASEAPAASAPEVVAPSPAAPAAPTNDKALERLREELEKTRTQLEQAAHMKREADASRRAFEKMVEQKFNLAKQKIRDEAGKAAHAREEAARLGRELEAARGEAAEGDKLRQLAEDHAAQLDEQRSSLEVRFQEDMKVARAEWDEKEHRLTAEREALEQELEQLRQELNHAREQAASDLEEVVSQAREAAEQERASRATELASLTEQLATVDVDKARLEEELEALRGHSAEAGRQVEDLTRERDEGATAMAGLRDEVESLQEARQALAEELESARARNAEDASQLDRLTEERDAAHERLAALEDELAAERASRDEAQAALTGERDTARQRVEELERQLEALGQERDTSGQRAEEAQRQIDVLRQEREDEQRVLATERDDACQRAEALETELATLREELEKEQAAVAVAQDALTRERDELAGRVKTLEESLAAAREGGDAAARDAGERARQAEETLTEARSQWEEQRVALESQLAEANAVMGEFDKLREDMESGRRAVQEAAERQEQELDSLEQTLRREAEEALENERARLEREFDERLAKTKQSWQADVGVDTAGDVAAFMAGDERVDRLEAELATSREELERTKDALRSAEVAREAAEEQLRQTREVVPRKEDLPDDQNRLVDPAKIRELMERRRELLKRQSKEKD
ncbi:MAG: cyclic nucleotide-binding domain-containing protein [Gammaproteobacteria bacterium]|nr:cyclic nucleotide-binding domain-containing protein [Gammaproteobacteria bacterium]